MASDIIVWISDKINASDGKSTSHEWNWSLSLVESGVIDEADKASVEIPGNA